MRKTTSMLLVASVVGMLAQTQPAVAGESAVSRSRAEATWWWDSGAAVGRTALTRSADTLRATYRATALTPGDAVTLWMIVFNHPEACSTSPCTIPDDVFNTAAAADFFWADGTVVGASGRAHFAGSLDVGDITHSGKAETGLAAPVALSNPAGAEVVLALHSHGPAATGADLTSQLTTFTGGCVVFNGPNGFAGGPGDVPDAPGECSTITRALHD